MTPLLITLLALAAVAAVALTVVVLRRRRPAPPTTRATPIRLTQHARERMALRGVTLAQIEATVAHPRRVTPCPAQGSVCLESVHGEGVLKVWVVAPQPGVHETVVKSTAWCFERTVAIPAGAHGRVVGRGGCTVRRLQATSNTRISVNGASVTVRADSSDALNHGCRLVAEVASSRQPVHA